MKLKENLLHGEEGKWLEEKVEFSVQIAQKFIKVANEYANSSVLRELSQSGYTSKKREDFISQLSYFL
ncbi:DUF3102 domain-containing protein [Clostridium arbusti]|uniref:DUF3102 domain-containing protein n=1 Tax=Clostridium arbusti TaxID=1137848 RepID=UPI0035A243F9